MVISFRNFKYLTVYIFVLVIYSNIYSQNDTLRILEISDTHLVTELQDANPIFSKVRNHLKGSTDSLKKFFKIFPEKLKTDAVVINGDIIDFYKTVSRKYGQVVSNPIQKFNLLSELLNKPLFLTLGNHDIASYLVNEIDSTKIETSIDVEQARAEWIRNVRVFQNGTFYKKEFMLGSTKYHLFFLDNAYNLNEKYVNGQKKVLDKIQLDWLNAQLEKTKNEPVILFLHIYFPVGDINGDGIYFNKNQSINSFDSSSCSYGLLKLLNEHSNIKAMFVGHQHRNVWEEIKFPSGNKIYQIQTSALFKTTKNWRLIRLTENKIEVSKPGSRKTEITIPVIANIEVIPDEINGLHVEVLPPGNNCFKDIKTKNSKILPDRIKTIIKLISPENAKITEWKQRENGEYFVQSINGIHRYYYTFSEDENLKQLRYKNYFSYIDLRPNTGIIKGTKKGINRNEIPPKTLKVLSKFFENINTAKYYKINTSYGKKFLVVNEQRAIIINLDGQIQTIGFIKDGALKENDASNLEKLKTKKEVLADCDSLLKNYKEKFSFKKAIEKIKKTIGDNTQFRFVLMGDSRSNKKIWSSIIEHINRLSPKPDFIINTGDIVRHGYAKEYAEYFVPVLLKNNIPYLVAIGNHDDGVRDSAMEFRYLFGENSQNYFFDLGKFRFIIFDNSSRINGNGEGLFWLEKTLASTPKGLSIIVFAHKPPAVVKKWAWHSWNEKNSEKFVDLMTKYKVKEVFTGHIHGYSTEIVNGISYTISGGGGAELNHRFGEEGDVYHYIICDAMPDGSIKQQIVKFKK